MKILCLIDSPTLATGFARVGQNLFPHWTAAGATVHVWGIGYNGLGQECYPDVKIFPAGHPWNSEAALETFLLHLAREDYTHLFMLQDTFQFSHRFCQNLAHVCTSKNIRSAMYFPVDAPLEPEWTEILSVVDTPIAYTQWGQEEAQRQAAKLDRSLSCKVLPHGVNLEIYHPRPDERAKDRSIWRSGSQDQPIFWLKPDDFLLLNVNANQRRKEPAAALVLLAELRKSLPHAKLIMHCRAATVDGVDLPQIGRQLGLELWRDWVHSGALFGRGDTSFLGHANNGRPLIGSAVPEPDLARYYNAADLLISTSLGEGWGLSTTEALACGCPVAMPNHTALAEIHARMNALDPDFTAQQFLLLPANDRIALANEISRLRWRLQIAEAVPRICDFADNERHGDMFAKTRPPLPAAIADWLSWPRIAGEMLKFLRGT